MANKLNRPFAPNTPNADVLNYLRGDLSPSYRSRIPHVDDANITSTMETLMNSEGLRNEFLNAYLNKVGLSIFRDLNWSNRLARFKIGELTHGEFIEEAAIGLTKARVYDPNSEYLERDLFGQFRPEVLAAYHKINSKRYYPITVNEVELRKAFTDDYGLSNLVTSIIGSLTTSDQWDEFLLMAGLFAKYDKMNGFFKVNVPDIAALSSDSDDAKMGLRKIRAMAENLQVISRHYNAARMPSAATADSLVLFVTPEFKAAVDVNALAASFNPEYLNAPAEIVVIPADEFNVPGVQAILTVREFFVVADSYFSVKQQENVVGLTTNYYLHHHQVMSASPFVPAVMFWTGEGDVIPTNDTPVDGITSITLEDREGSLITTLTRGEAHQLRARATTDPENGINDGVIFRITGAESPYTYVSQTGGFFVGVDESSRNITVRASATDAALNEYTTTRVFPVIGDLVPIWPRGEFAPDADRDGNLEVTPEEPEYNAATKVIKVPNMENVEYKIGSTVITGNHTIAANSTVTATAKTGWELTPGATASWSYTV